MTTIGIIFFILVILGFFYLFINLWKDDDGWVLGGIESLFSTILVVFFIFLVFALLGEIGAKHEKSQNFGITYISSLSTNSSLSGSFFLGCGSIENKNYYYFISNSELGYRIAKIENDGNIYVKEDCNKKPFIEFTKYNAISINWFAKIFFKTAMYDKDGEIIIHVPKNTVVKNYNVDVSKL